MDLDNMKTVWAEISEQVARQNKLTNEIILKMAHSDSKNRLRKIFRVELLSAICALTWIVFIILNFYKLDTAVTLWGGITSIVICCLSILIWFSFFKRANRVNILTNSYKQTLIDFNICKKAYQLNKKLEYFLGVGFLIAICPVVFKLTRNSDIFSEAPLSDLLFYLIGGSVFYSIIVYLLQRFYNDQINKINKLLKDLMESNI